MTRPLLDIFVEEEDGGQASAEERRINQRVHIHRGVFIGVATVCSVVCLVCAYVS